MFDRASRYASIPVATYQSEERGVILYVRRRMLPPLTSGTSVKHMKVAVGQRLDTIAASVVGDPTQFWRITDVNDVLNPFDLLTEPGGHIRIPLPGTMGHNG